MSRWVVVRGSADEEALAALAAHARAPDASSSAFLRLGHTRAVADVPGLGVVKLQERVSLRQALASRVAPVGFVREFDLTTAAAERGVPAPCPLFVAERRFLGLVRSAAIVYEAIPDAPDLADVVGDCTPAPGRRRAAYERLDLVLGEVGAVAASLHRAGGLHGDLTPDNFLIPASGQPVLIDWLSASFAGHRLAGNRLGQYLSDKESAHRFSPHSPRRAGREFRAAQAGYAERGPASPDFRRLGARDLSRLLVGLVCSGASPRQVMRVLRGYSAGLGLDSSAHGALASGLLVACVRKLRRVGARAIERAERATRAVGVRRTGAITICWRRECSDPMTALHDAGVPSPDARDAWRNACAASELRLPAAPYLAAEFDRRTGAGRVLMGDPAVPHRVPGLRAAGDAERLGVFVRLVHALGFRFHTCEDGTLLAQSEELGPFTMRAGSGYVLADLTAVAFAPGAPCEESLETVAEWAERQLPRAGATLRGLGRPPRQFKL